MVAVVLTMEKDKKTLGEIRGIFHLWEGTLRKLSIVLQQKELWVLCDPCFALKDKIAFGLKKVKSKDTSWEI